MEGSSVVDHRADIYSLGVVFYEMLTGDIPAGHFDPPSKKVQVDVRLDEVVLRAMAREPDRRYQHASDVKSDVESISKDSKGARAPAGRIAKQFLAESSGPTRCNGCDGSGWNSRFGRFIGNPQGTDRRTRTANAPFVETENESPPDGDSAQAQAQVGLSKSDSKGSPTTSNKPSQNYSLFFDGQ